ncbi:MAG: TIGR01548 family HAD-type hydrolase [Cyanobacteria bacterium P01_H01_bin.119]
MPPSSGRAIAVFDIDGVIRDVSGSYRRAIADTVEHFTEGRYRPTVENIDQLKSEGIWNNDWHCSQELVYRYSEAQGRSRTDISLNYDALVHYFQCRYRGPDPDDSAQWTGYIAHEPLLVTAAYFEQLTEAGIIWGFFSGATRGSASYVIEQRLGLKNPVLITMEDAPGKPDPKGLLMAIAQLEAQHPKAAKKPVFYIGDTVADIKTPQQAKAQQPERLWFGLGVLPPHVLPNPAYAKGYAERLTQAGAIAVFEETLAVTPDVLQALLASHR